MWIQNSHASFAEAESDCTLTSFLLFAEPVKVATFNAYRDMERGPVK